MTAGGFAGLLGVYVLTSLVGVIVADVKDDNPRLHRYGRRLLIPVAGPWIAISDTRSATAAWFTGFSGVLQAAGLVLGMVGAIRLGTHRAKTRLAFDGSMHPGGGRLGVTLRF